MASTGQMKFLTYNVWSREDAVVRVRMQAIGKLVLFHKPDVILFQEVTPHILRIFQSHSWWEDYTCSPVEETIAPGQQFCLLLSKLPAENFSRCPFPNSPARRCYLTARVNPGDGLKPIQVATAHLESPDPPMAMHCEERAAQAKLAASALSSEENVVFGGDMSWDDKVDLPFPLLDGWVDAWTTGLKNDHCSYTYDALWNRDPRRAGSWDRKSRAISQRRSDRFVCKLKDYELKNVELIGRETRMKSRIYGSVGDLDIGNDRNDGVCFLPSSHFGVVLTIVPKVEGAIE